MAVVDVVDVVDVFDAFDVFDTQLARVTPDLTTDLTDYLIFLSRLNFA